MSSTSARSPRAAAAIAGYLLGVVTVPLDLFGVLAAPISPALTDRIASMEQRRLTRLLGVRSNGVPSGPRAVGYLAVRTLVGTLGALVLALSVLGVVVAVAVVYGAATGAAVPIIDATEPGQVSWASVMVLALPGAVLCFLAVQGLLGVVRAETWCLRRSTRPGQDELAQRVAQLTSTRAEVIEVIDDERRRIERDLHDGVQQRVVALSILLGRVEREADEDRRGELQRRAIVETGHILDELREVSWRIYPAMLARDGLHAALEALADRTPLPTRLDYALTERAPRPVESACYFTASEAITNAIKHSGAETIAVVVERDGPLVRLRVRDDGNGGADPTGHGLAGIATRVTALDGTMRVDSPPGGPTIVSVEVPCG
ncbi:sensor histidine kinase [Nocardia rhizosphaerihabitans]|uniref:histidine kinase n=1 Tax=Nocardia rhizosphaerihabitans TaxID=1691570 RepID=A0ABQ2K868_9NOCA|nr:histidine kinase [Nocardia rhizosphaerihabitans]GGN69000.1 ATPase [Nocardia rhizosphaerihabitans]